MNDRIKIKFLDGEIEYLEQSNIWRYSIDSDRVGDRNSLEAAKQLATNHAKEKSVFDRHPVLFLDGCYSSLETADVTSYSGDLDYSKRRQAWISKNGKRKLAHAQQLFEHSPENNALRVEIEKLETESSELQRKIKVLSSKLKPYVFRKPLTNTK